MLFVPHAQVDLPSMTLIVRAPAGVALVAPGVRDVLRQLDRSLPAPPIQEIAVSRGESVAGPRFNLSLLGMFAGIALILAVTGVYAMLAFTVSERRREIAVRLALGADGPRIARLILQDGLALAIAGIAAGTAAALAVTRVLSSVLYGITPTDPATFAAAAAGLLIVAALACYLPARHASRLDPVAILRR
jgi:putative ABC transport system permease protein